MTRETTLGYKYGVLRVQPQTHEHVPVKPYSHRNGETTPPEVMGRYWFSGWRTKHNGNRARVYDLVEIMESGGVYNDGDGIVDDVASYLGKWWGPVIPPWQASDGKAD